MVTEFVLMGFVCLFALSFSFLLFEHFRSEQRGREIEKKNQRIKDLEEGVAESTLKILDLQGELTEIEDIRNSLLNLNSELSSGLKEETSDCRELEAKNRQLNAELSRSIEIINELVDREGEIRKNVEEIQKFLDHHYEHFTATGIESNT